MSTYLADSDFELLLIERTDGVAFVTVDAPPMNVMTPHFFRELAKFGAQVAEDDSVRVVVLRSDDPDFFIAHFDVSAILEFPVEGPAEKPEKLEGFHPHVRDLPNHAQGHDRGNRRPSGRRRGGIVHVLRHAFRGFGENCHQPNGGSDRNSSRGNRNTAPTASSGKGQSDGNSFRGVDVDAKTAAEWGYLNRALPPEELRPYVNELALRIAGFPPTAVALAKEAVNNADTMPLNEGLMEERYLFQRLLRTDEAEPAMRSFLEVGGQTREAEKRMGQLVTEVDWS